MPFLLLLAGFCVLCLCGSVAVLIATQKLINRAFDLVNFVACYLDQHTPELDFHHPEGCDD